MNKKKLTPYLLIAPVIILMILLYGYPIFLTVIYSFKKVSLLGGNDKFIGFANYQEMLTDVKFYKTLGLTMRYTLLTITLKIFGGFALALLMNGRLYFKRGLRFLMLLPWALPQVAVSIVWQWMLDGNYGYINYYLQKLGIISQNITWLSVPRTAFFSTSVVDAWMGVPTVALMFLSGLSNIPKSSYEAAMVDGASKFKQFIYITIPGIKKVFLIVLTLVSIWTFNSFNVINILTQGGPMGATMTLIYRIYKETFSKFNLGMSSAMSMVVCVILLFMSALYWRQIEKEND